MKKKRKCLVYAAAVVFAAALLTAYVLWANTALQVNEIKISSSRLPDEFNGFCIAHVSDLHDSDLGNCNEDILTALREQKPDIIAVTGDFTDTYSADSLRAVEFAESAVHIAPVYFVTGNHEGNISESSYAQFEEKLCQAGVKVLRCDAELIERNGQFISVCGVDDPIFSGEKITAERLRNLFADNGFKVLLSHRPELMDVYSDAGIDLVLSGHAHGGQFRLPFIGGLYAPHQGVFPEYDSGLFNQGRTYMVVSRGIGNSVFPLRLNNRPELIFIELIQE